MSHRFRLSLMCVVMLVCPMFTRAQAPLCDNKKEIDNAINWISRTYDYTSLGWQNACDSLLGLCPDLDQVWQMKAMPAAKMGD